MMSERGKFFYRPALRSEFEATAAQERIAQYMRYSFPEFDYQVTVVCSERRNEFYVEYPLPLDMERVSDVVLALVEIGGAIQKDDSDRISVFLSRPRPRIIH
jgi:hypothetical protein